MLIGKKGKHGLHYRSRSHMSANTSDHRGLERREVHDPFGLYRFLQPVSAQAIVSVMDVARPKVHKYLQSKRPNGGYSNIRLPESWFVVILDEAKVETAMKTGDMSRGLETGLLLRDIERGSAAVSQLEVPIKEFFWRGSEHRNYTASISESEGLTELYHQTEAIHDLLKGCDIQGIAEEHPNRLKIGTYGVYGDQYELDHDLRIDVGDILESEFEAQNVTSFVLGGIAVARGVAS